MPYYKNALTVLFANRLNNRDSGTVPHTPYVDSTKHFTE